MIWMGWSCWGMGLRRGDIKVAQIILHPKNLIVPSPLPLPFYALSSPHLPFHTLREKERDLEKKERKKERSFFLPWHPPPFSLDPMWKVFVQVPPILFKSSYSNLEKRKRRGPDPSARSEIWKKLASQWSQKLLIYVNPMWISVEARHTCGYIRIQRYL